MNTLFQDTDGKEVMLMGLSLSFCVKDMMSGRIDPRQVHSVMTSCVPSEGGLPYISPDDFPQDYYLSYWCGYTPGDVQEKVQDVLFLARRSDGGINISEGHWMVKVGDQMMFQVRYMDAFSRHVADGFHTEAFFSAIG